MSRLPRRLAALAALVTLGLSGCAGDGVTRIEVSEVGVGSCFSMDVEGRVAFVVDCAAPHRYEATARVKLDGDALPNAAALQAKADEFCPAAFADRLGTAPIVATEWVSEAITPSAEAWDAGARSLICVAARADGAPATGPLPKPTTT